jgi:hypothetical protein
MKTLLIAAALLMTGSAAGAKLAVRIMQIDRRLGLAQQMQFVAKIPLAH